MMKECPVCKKKHVASKTICIEHAVNLVKVKRVPKLSKRVKKAIVSIAIVIIGVVAARLINPSQVIVNVFDSSDISDNMSEMRDMLESLIAAENMRQIREDDLFNIRENIMRDLYDLTDLELGELIVRARNGNLDAQLFLGGAFLWGNSVPAVPIDYDYSAVWFRMAAEQGNALAQNGLGIMYNLGWGLPVDYEQSLYWIERSAIQGDTLGQYWLGIAYLSGNGVEQDYFVARHWFRRAALQGHINSQFRLGLMYQRGDGIIQDYSQAIYWFTRAAEQGHTSATIMLGTMYGLGRGVERDFEHALHLIRNAGEQGDADMQYSISRFFSGTLDEVYWLRRAAEQGHAQGQHRLGIMYVYGLGVDTNITTALYWFRQSAMHGYDGGQFVLAGFYENGFVVEQNLNQAIYWYQQAAGQGHAGAITRLQNIEQ